MRSQSSKEMSLQCWVLLGTEAFEGEKKEEDLGMNSLGD